MSKATYPSGIPYIIGNEAAERFSYYGMKCILVVFMTRYLQDTSGAAAPMSEEQARVWYHLFGTANYFFPVLGALLADIFWGKYKTIINLSIVYCLGHLLLAVSHSQLALALGLMLIAIGAGGIKPCVSAHVGDQFDTRNASLLERTFSYFYLAINLGAFASTLLTPLLLEWYGPALAFGIPGALMLLATLIFRAGRSKFVALPPAGWQDFRSELFSSQGKQAVFRLTVLYGFIALFWGLFDQTGSSWVLQAEKMDKNLSLFGFQFSILSAQLQSLNPVLILILVPVFSLILYPFAERFLKLTALRKIGAGFFLSALSFLIIAHAESLLVSGVSVSILYQVLAYVLLTAAEILVSITALEFSYTQAPVRLKSLVMGIFFLSVSLGNLITAFINSLIDLDIFKPYLTGAAYYYFFAILMILNSAIFVWYFRSYTEREYYRK